MTVHEAVNPRHTRKVDTSNLWWLEDAWNERTVELITNDETHLLFASVVEGITFIQRMNLPELLPPSDWLVGLAEIVLDLPPVPKKAEHLPMEMRAAFKLEVLARSKNPKLGVANLRNTSKQIMAAAPLTDLTFDHRVFFKKDRKGQWQINYDILLGAEKAWNSASDFSSSILAGLAINPALPLLKKTAHPDTTMTVYRWMLARALVDSSSSAPARELLPELLRNFNASQEDFEFVLRSLDQTTKEHARRQSMKRARFDPANYNSWPPLLPQGNVKHLLSLISQHPNFVAWPSVDEAHPVGQRIEGDRAHGMASTIVPHFVNAPPRSLHQENEAQEDLLNEMLFGEETAIRERLANRLRIFSDPSTILLGRVSAASEVGVFAVFLGVMFAETERALNAEDIPLEWLIEVL